MKTSNTSSGFTLLEMLLAIFIFSVVTATVYGSFNFIVSSIETIEAGIDSGEMAKVCLDRMITDLTSMHVTLPPAYKQPGFNDDPELYRVVGEKETIGGTECSKLRFASSEHLPFGQDSREGIAEIIYYVHETDENIRVLRRSDSLYPYEPFEEKKSDPILCEQVKSLTFSYYDEDEEENDTWDSESGEFGYGTPVAIGITLEIGDEVSSSLFKTMVNIPVSRKKKE